MSGPVTEARNSTKVARKSTQPSVAERRLKIAIAAAMFAGLALSPKLWLTARLYPTTPVLPLLGSIPAPLAYVLYAALLALLVAIAVTARPAALIGLFALVAIGVALFDQSRWQPWFYQYLVMLIAVGLYDRGRGNHDDAHNPALNACRLVVVCTYFWSGLQKANASFVTRVFPLLIQPLSGLLPASMGAVVNWLGFAAPFIELAIGVGLLTRRFRKFAIFLAFGMHGFILLAIGPLGQSSNNVVWPWNIAMLCFLMILFWQRPELSARQIVWPREGFYQKIVLLLFGIAPALSFFNLWDGYLSSALYSGVRNTGVIYVTDAAKDRLPKEILPHIYPSNKPGTGILILQEWAMSELNAGIYPEPRIYKNLARYICGYARDPSEVKLWIKQSNVLFSPDKQVSYDCPALISPAARTGNQPMAP
jgi:hypothetical protein